MTLHIIIPVYNAGRYLTDALNSVVFERMNATYSINIILINDGSTDNSEEICLAFAGRYSDINYIYQNNQGVSVARNMGLKYVFEHGEENDWIGFLDADDVFHSGWASNLEEGIYSDADVIGYGMILADSQLKPQSTKLPPSKIIHGGFETAISENRKSHFGSYLYRSRLLLNFNIGFIPKVSNGEDLIFKYASFLIADRLCFYPLPLYVYRKNDHSVTSNYTRDACKYYEVLMLGWHGFFKWLTMQEPNENVQKAISFVRERINCTCMFASRSYCLWHNGSYINFKQSILCGFLPAHILDPVDFGDDSLLREYRLLSKTPWLFFIKYFLKGIFCPGM